MFNEEGLPFHEIRETLNGETIGSLPPAAGDPTADMGDLPKDEEDDYWSEDAVARRAALRKKIFHEGEESDDEEFIEQVQQQPQVPDRSLPSDPPAPNTQSSQLPSSPSSPKAELHPHSILRHHTPSSQQPKSILKPPIHKKSVTFDPSIPPASPDSSDIAPSSIKPHKFGFPLPLATDDDQDWAPKPVPTITEPKPKAKKDDGFAGFRKGFLGPPPKVLTAENDQPSSSSPPHPTVISGQGPPPESAQEALKPKKKSLFAQRLAHSEIDASAPATSSGTPATASPRGINLPRMAESKGTLAIKGAVVEKPAATPVINPSSPHTADNIVERHIAQPITSSSTSTQDPSSSSSPGISVTEQKEDDSVDSFAEYSSGSEDEYDLDDALLAREVALEYHRRHAYASLNRDPRDAPYEEDDNGAGVMLGLPRISDLQGQDGGPVITNPTPDDLRRFIRVGRLENGNLVLAPGQEGLSDSEGDGEEEKQGEEDGEEVKEKRERRLEVKKRREQVRNRLMGLPVEGDLEPQSRKDGVDDERLKAMLPPAIQTEVAERQDAPISSAQVDTSAEAGDIPVPKKKVSRFKAARLAGAQ